MQRIFLVVITALASIAHAGEWKCPTGAKFVADKSARGCQKPDGTLHGKWIMYFKNGNKFREGKKHGLWTALYESGVVNERGTCKEGLKHGKWIYWHSNGQKSLEGKYDSDVQTGRWTMWNEDGRKYSEGVLKGGEKDGEWTFWDDKGKASVCIYKDGLKMKCEDR
jgi:antitoxin component YwqK of YwqJK toxin-antitoxin module